MSFSLIVNLSLILSLFLALYLSVSLLLSPYLYLCLSMTSIARLNIRTNFIGLKSINEFKCWLPINYQNEMCYYVIRGGKIMSSKLFSFKIFS